MMMMRCKGLIAFMPREAKSCADFLAKFWKDPLESLVILEEPSQVLKRLLDEAGVIFNSV